MGGIILSRVVMPLAATASNKRQLEHEQRLREHRIARARKDAEAFAGTLQGSAVPLYA